MAMAMAMHPPMGSMNYPQSFHQGYASMPVGENPYAMPRVGSMAVPAHQVGTVASPPLGTFSGMPGMEIPRSNTMSLGPPIGGSAPAYPAYPLHPLTIVPEDFSGTPYVVSEGLPANMVVMNGPPTDRPMTVSPSFNSMRVLAPAPSFASAPPTGRTVMPMGPVGVPPSASFYGGVPQPGMLPPSQSFASGRPAYFQEQPLTVYEAADMCQGSAYAEGAIAVAEQQAKNALLVTQQALQSLGGWIDKSTSLEKQKSTLSQVDYVRLGQQANMFRDETIAHSTQAQKLTGDAMRTLTYIVDMLLRNSKRAELAASRIINDGSSITGPASENRKDRAEMAHRYAQQAAQFSQSASCFVADCLDQQHAAVAAASTEAKVAQINMSANAATKAATQAALASRVLAQASETILDLISGA